MNKAKRFSFEIETVNVITTELDGAVDSLLDALCAIGATATGSQAVAGALVHIHTARTLLDNEAKPECEGGAS